MNKSCFSLIILVMLMGMSISANAQDRVRDHLPVGKLQLYYEIVGTGKPVLFIHAGLQTHDMWEPQVKKLEDKFRIILVDLPGHGLTKGVDAQTPISTILKALLDKLGVDKVSIVGISMGSLVAQDFALAYPAQVEKLVLVSPGVNGYDKIKKVDSISMAWYPEMQAALKAKDTAQAARVFADAWAKGPYRVVGTIKNDAYNKVYHATLENMKLHQLKGFPVFSDATVSIKKLNTIKVPVMLIDGDKDLPYVNTSTMYLQRMMPHAKRMTVRGAAHMINLEDPEKFSEVIKNFLQD